MNSGINLLETWSWIFPLLLGVAFAGWAGGALDKKGAASATLHSAAHLLYLSAIFVGVSLIAVLCGLLAFSMLGQSWLASCLAIAMFMGIGANLIDEDFGDSD